MSVLALLASLVQSAAAGDMIDEIVVEADSPIAAGVRAEAEADLVVEILSAETLRAQASSELAEALARVPGVTLQSEGGDLRYVQLRGIRPALGSVTLDGLEIGAPGAEGGGRQFPLDLFSTRLLGRLEVVKTPLPAMTGQGIGGIVNLRSHDPLAPPPAAISARAGGGGKTALEEATLLVGKRSADGVFGAVLAVTASAEDRERGVREQRRWGELPGAPIPRQLRSYDLEEDENRLGGVLTLGAAPRPGHRVALRLMGARLGEEMSQDRYENQLTAAEGDILSGTALSGIGLRFRRVEADRDLLLASLEGTHALSGMTTASWTLAATRSSYDEAFLQWNSAAPAPAAPLSYVVRNDFLRFPEEPRSGLIEAAGIEERRSDRVEISDEALLAKAALGHAVTASLRLDLGGQWRRTERRNAVDSQRLSPVDSLPLAAVSPLRTAFVSTPRGDYPVTGISGTSLEAYLAANPGAFAGNPLADLIASTAEDFTLTETVSAAYLSAHWEKGPWSVIAGLRAERTDLGADGTLLSVGGLMPLSRSDTRTDWLPSVVTKYQLTDRIILRAAAMQRVGRPGYDLIAPRAAFESDGTAAQLTIGNPGLDARRADSFDLTAEYYPAPDAVVGLSVFRHALSDEIYPQVTLYEGEEALAALRAFGLDALAPPGGLDLLAVTRPENVEGYGLTGIELSFSGSLRPFSERLAPFSLSAAVTVIDEDGTFERGYGTEGLTLVEQTDAQASALLAYDRKRFSGSVGYRWGGDYLSGLGSAPARDTTQRAAGSLDLRASYAVTDRLQLRLDGLNLTDEVAREYQGPDPDRPTLAQRYGRSVLLGVRYGL
ncbi:TonB-dependent receptor [Parvularcula oceani]|uniref:TonB-dependent receptor n=1 Tax=Parvularcula oceani TaxID=1247963 RepID=UPI0004E1592D|nr:TonB-dependent receptor [Parvularcula oceani]